MRARWTEDLSVGVDVIDNQHKELFSTADSLLTAVERDEGRGEVTKVVAFLEGYVETHFQMEEMYMKRHNYPDYPAHKIDHTTFISDFYDLRQELDNNGVTPELTVRLANWIGEWLVNHIGRMDKALGAFLRERK
ncbi:MAG: hemerythrin family protein [Deltaproteobacteria bacterium]|nr:hemerythrin family protein [Deltaproteobacteria bacterium]NNG45740.1 hemerythrin family protein [Deltaproteobacteria bacterium]